MRAPSSLAAVLVFTGCGDPLDLRHIPWPPFDPETRALIIAIGTEVAPIGDSERFRLEAVSIDDLASTTLRLDFEGEPGLDLRALAYADTLESLAIDHGRLARPDGQTIRAVPPPDAFFRYRSDGTTSPWSEEAGADEVIDEIRLATFDRYACLSAERCPSAASRAVCRSPCGLVEEPARPIPPTPPRALSMLDEACALGASTSTQSFVACEPALPDPGCGSAEAQPPGRSTCAPIGAPCPARWPDVGTATQVLWVDDDAAAGGDGSPSTPFLRITEALQVARDGTVIAIARGRYQESLTPQDEVTLLGACAADTVVEVSAGPGLAAIGAVIARDLRIEGGEPGALVLGPSAELTLGSVAIHGGTTGVLVQTGRLSATDLLVRDTSSIGVFIERGGRVIVERAHVERSTRALVQVEGSGSRFEGRALVLRAPLGQDGYGLVAGTGAEVVLEGALIEGVPQVSLAASGSSTSVALSEVLIRDGGPSAIQLSAGTRLTGARIAALRTGSAALHLLSGSHAEVDDLRVWARPSRTGEAPTYAVAATNGSTGIVRRARLEGGDVGIGLETAARLDLRDIELESTAGNGITVNGADVVAERMRMVNTSAYGLVTGGVNASFRFEDLSITGQAGIYLAGIGDLVTGTRLRIGPTVGLALLGTGDTMFDLTDFVAFEAHGGADRQAGAVSLKAMAFLKVERFILEDHEVAALDIDVSAELTFQKVLRHGIVRRNRYGMIWRGVRDDVEAVMEDVLFTDNDELLGSAQ